MIMIARPHHEHDHHHASTNDGLDDDQEQVVWLHAHEEDDDSVSSLESVSSFEDDANEDSDKEKAAPDTTNQEGPRTPNRSSGRRIRQRSSYPQAADSCAKLHHESSALQRRASVNALNWTKVHCDVQEETLEAGGSPTTTRRRRRGSKSEHLPRKATTTTGSKASPLSLRSMLRDVRMQRLSAAQLQESDDDEPLLMSGCHDTVATPTSTSRWSCRADGSAYGSPAGGGTLLRAPSRQRSGDGFSAMDLVVKSLHQPRLRPRTSFGTASTHSTSSTAIASIPSNANPVAVASIMVDKTLQESPSARTVLTLGSTTSACTNTRSRRRFSNLTATSPRLTVADTSGLRRVRSIDTTSCSGGSSTTNPRPCPRRIADTTNLLSKRNRLQSARSLALVAPRLPPRQITRESSHGNTAPALSSSRDKGTSQGGAEIESSLPKDG